VPGVPLPSYATRHEVNFLTALHATNPRAFRRYCYLVEHGLRSYDRTVNVAEIKLAIHSLRTGMRTQELPA
jgi:hypothetical protein